MKKENDPKIQAAKWFLEFLSDDFNNMSELDLAKRAVEARYYLWRPRSWIWRPQEIPIWHDRKTVGGIDPVPKVPADYPWKNNLKQIQDELKKELGKRLSNIESMGPLFDVHCYWGVIGGKFNFGYSIVEGAYDSYDITNLIKLSLISFIHSLEGFSADEIKTCQECGKYFLHLSKKPKYFCSPRCTSKSISRRRRKENPQKYRDYQRAVMRDKYRIEKGLKPKKFYKDRIENGGKEDGSTSRVSEMQSPDGVGKVDEI